MRPSRSDWFPCSLIALPFVLGLVFAPIRSNVPIIDDWVYAWSVEHLLKVGELRVAAISAVHPIAQILWGALFARLGGFSFGMLRLSTLVLSVAGCCALYFTLRELSIGVAASLLAALTMACDPVFYALSFSFMTDVPFVDLTCIALFLHVSGLSRGRPLRLWGGAAFAVLAFLVRPTGIVLPVAAVLVVVARAVRQPRDATGFAGFARCVAPAAPMLAALGAMTAIWPVLPRAFGPLDAQAGRFADMRSLLLVTPSEYAATNASVLLALSFPFAPMLLRALTTARMAAWTLGLAAVLAIVLLLTLRHIPTPLLDWQTWSLQDVAARAMLGGTVAPSAMSVHLKPFVQAAGILTLSGLIVGGASALRRAPAEAWLLLLMGGMNLVLINVLWFYNDRYYVIFIPALAYIWARLPASRAGNILTAVMVALWMFVSVTGVRDMLATNGAVARLTRDLESEGVPAWEIDAGYPLNGWRLYVHPENLPPGADRRYQVPYVTANPSTLYRIVSGLEPGYDVVRTEPLPWVTWQVTDRLLVVRRKQ